MLPETAVFFIRTMNMAMNSSKSFIQVFIVNLPDRTKRKKHVLNQFANKKTFRLQIVPPVKHPVAAVSLWHTIQYIIQKRVNPDLDFFILCEDDHQFTDQYSFKLLMNCIEEAKALNAAMLSGGVSWFKTGVQISKNLFWVERFSGLQFTVIFKNFYQKILNADFAAHEAADYKLSDLTDKKFIIYPYISKQKEFGYSDVTLKNNEPGHVEKLFEETSERFALLKQVRRYYLPDFK